MSAATERRAGDAAAGGAGLDAAIARLLTLGTYLSVGLLALGVAAMVAGGVSPLERRFPPLDVAAIPGDILALRPHGFLWLGLLAVIATPAARVVASLAGYVASRETRMAAVAVGILVVIGSSVILALATEA